MAVFNLSCPRTLEIFPGAHPTKVFRSISGATRTRLSGSRPVNSNIKATFLCSSADAARTIQLYHSTFSGGKPISLPAKLFTGYEELAGVLPPLQWFMLEPEIRPVFPGRVEVSVEFEGRLEV